MTRENNAPFPKEKRFEKSLFSSSRGGRGKKKKNAVGFVSDLQQILHLSDHSFSSSEGYGGGFCIQQKPKESAPAMPCKSSLALTWMVSGGYSLFHVVWHHGLSGQADVFDGDPPEDVI